MRQRGHGDTSAVTVWWPVAAGSFWGQHGLGKAIVYSQMYWRGQEFITGAQRDKGLKKQVKMNEGVVNNWPPISGQEVGQMSRGRCS